jgi:hypothetical protein
MTEQPANVPGPQPMLPVLVMHVNVPIPGSNPPQHLNMPVASAREMLAMLTAIMAQVDAAAKTPAIMHPTPARKNRR